MTIDLAKRGSSVPLGLEHSFRLLCAGRAAEGLRAEWQRQLKALQDAIPFSHLRFHGLFHDEMMVCSKGSDGELIYNFRYIDSLFDFLLSVGIKPFIELGFMPTAIASGDQTLFWWRANVTPPKELSLWNNLLINFFNHCIERWGLEEVRTWYIEVWNEPCIVGEFWAGTQQEYFDLYAASVTTIKALDNHLKVGGPSSAFFTDGKAPWMEDFIDFVLEKELPLDFVTAHPYPVWWQAGEFSESAKIYYRDRGATASDLTALKELLEAKGLGHLEVHVTEWNSSFLCRDVVHDTAFKAPFIIANVLATEGLCDSLGYWAFSDLFEEHAAGDSLFHGGFGLLTENGLKKPAYWGYWFLKQLGAPVIERGEGYAIVEDEDEIRILLYNYVDYKEGYYSSASTQPEDPYMAFSSGQTLNFVINLPSEGFESELSVTTFTREENSLYDNWVKIERPEYPTVVERALLEKLSQPTTKRIKITKQAVALSLEPFQVSLIAINKINSRENHL